MKPCRVFLSALLAAALVGSFIVGVIQAQPAPPPLPPPAGANTPGDGDNDDVEVYTRGTLHEAFAKPATNDVVVPPIVQKAPPPLIEELPPEQQPEGENVTWIAGYWAWDEEADDYVWISGLWRDVPPGRQWIPGYWAQTPEGYQWVAGMWADDGATSLTYLPTPPDSLEQGPSIEAPSPDHFYVPGNWEYRDTRYAWRAGYWAPRQRDWIWVPAHYVYTPYGCCFVAGHWDYALVNRGMCYAPVRFRHVRPAYVYRPVIVIDTWDTLVMHLWVNPRRGCYVYGNYYDAPPARFVPWYNYHGYGGHWHRDPMFSYYEWRNGPDYRHRLNGWHEHFVAQRDMRPPVTYREQVRFVETHRSTPNVNVNLAIDLTKINRDRDRDVRLPVAIKPVSREQESHYREQAKGWVAAAQERRQVEAKPDGRIEKNDKPDRDVQPKKVAFNVPKAVAAVDRKEIQRPESPDKLTNVTPDKPRGENVRVPARVREKKSDLAKTNRDEKDDPPSIRADVPPPPGGRDGDAQANSKDDRKDRNPRDAFGLGQDSPPRGDRGRGDLPERTPGQGRAQTDPNKPGREPKDDQPIPRRGDGRDDTPRTPDAPRTPIGRPQATEGTVRDPRDNRNNDPARSNLPTPRTREGDRGDDSRKMENDRKPDVPRVNRLPGAENRNQQPARNERPDPTPDRPKIDQNSRRGDEGRRPGSTLPPQIPSNPPRQPSGPTANPNRSPDPNPKRPDGPSMDRRDSRPQNNPTRDNSRTDSNRRDSQPRANTPVPKANEPKRGTAPEKSKKSDDKDKDKDKDKPK